MIVEIGQPLQPVKFDTLLRNGMKNYLIFVDIKYAYL